MNIRAERKFMIFLLAILSLQVFLKLTLWPPEETFGVVLLTLFVLLWGVVTARTVQLHRRIRREPEREAQP